MNKKSVKYSVYFLILFYVVGTLGFILPLTHSFFKILTPLALLLSAGFLIWFHRPGFDLRTLVVFATIFIFSFVAEMVGVQTGLVFGHYDYGKALGLAIMGTPLIIGLNWLMLVYCTNIIAEKFTSNAIIISIVGGLLMVGYDLVLEQTAPELGMWSWAGGKIPLQNYLSWFIFAFLFHLLIKKAKVQIKNPLAIPVFVIQFLFFVALMIYFMFHGS